MLQVGGRYTNYDNTITNQPIFGSRGATEDGVKIMLETANGRIKVKPFGGVRDYARARMFVEMGVHRLGVNYPSTPIICEGMEQDQGTSSNAY
jgi:deoxyribose-phosphate aldolase